MQLCSLTIGYRQEREVFATDFVNGIFFADLFLFHNCKFLNFVLSLKAWYLITVEINVWLKKIKLIIFWERITSLSYLISII